MNPAEFEHPPLGRIVEGLSRPDGLTPAEVKASLREKGYDPDALVTRLMARAAALSRESRLSWMQQGDALQARANAAGRTRRSWLGRTADEINAAFNAVRSGRYGTHGQLRVQTAFSNLTSITVESKAAFLDEVDILLELQHETPSEPPPTP